MTDPASAVAGSDLIILVVADPPAVESVVERILPALRSGQILIQSSTVSAACNRLCASLVMATGADFLEAPFTGSKPAAASAAQTVFYVGGRGRGARARASGPGAAVKGDFCMSERSVRPLR